MKLNDLIKSSYWLSVELMFLKLYPDCINVIEDHKKVFEKIKLLEPKPYEMEIVVRECEDYFEDEITNYVDVSGKKLNKKESISYALEFTDWEKWLGMTLAQETINNFTSLEIISHCLYEMTFVDYEENEIKEQFDKIKNLESEYIKLTEEEKKERTISVEELMKKLKKGNN